MSTAEPEEEEPPEHLRYAVYLRALEEVGDDEELALVSAVLTDPDQSMASGAVALHMHRRVPEMMRSPAFPVWYEGMARAVSGHAFLVKRLGEWALFRTVALDLPWTTDQLTAASDWLQRLISQGRHSAEAHAILAEQGRTRRVRNAARVRLGNRPR